MNQMSLFDIIRPSKEQRNKEHEESCAWWWNWLVNTRKVDANECYDVFNELVEKFGRIEAFDRSKALDTLSSERRIDGWSIADLEIIGLFDESLDYHTVWDRAWAARNGMPKEDVARLKWWDYSSKREHVFA